MSTRPLTELCRLNAPKGYLSPVTVPGWAKGDSPRRCVWGWSEALCRSHPTTPGVAKLKVGELLLL
jgi:hypothetical protein